MKLEKNFFSKKWVNLLCIVINIILIIIIIIYIVQIKNNSHNKTLIISNKLVKTNYNILVSILGKPNYIETNGENKLNSATWMSPLDNFNDFGKFGGCDYIKINGHVSKKWHPYPANVFLIVGKYIHVPEHLFGPIKFASETINIEQLFVPVKYSNKYYNTGIKELALVTGSCASITISVITVKFVMDMINKYKQTKTKSLELYDEFRNEYDRRINDYLCGKGITDHIDWYDPSFFGEADTAYLGDDKCLKKIQENYSHFPECKELMEDTNFCKDNPAQKCC